MLSTSQVLFKAYCPSGSIYSTKLFIWCTGNFSNIKFC